MPDRAPSLGSAPQALSAEGDLSEALGAPGARFGAFWGPLGAFEGAFGA